MKKDCGTKAHDRLRIVRGRAQLSKGVSSPALDLYIILKFARRSEARKAY